MSKITVNVEELGNLTPYILGMFIDNPDLINDVDTERFYDRISKKIKTDLRQHILNTPDARRQFKLIKKVFTGGDNAVIQIKAKTSNEEHQNQKKYLTENYKNPLETCKKYLKE